MSIVKVDLRSSPMLVKINLSEDSDHGYSSISQSNGSYLNHNSPSVNKTYLTRCSFSASQHLSPQSLSASQNAFSISPTSSITVNQASQFLPSASPSAQAQASCRQTEEDLQRQVEVQALQNLELREQLQREKTRTHLVLSQNLSMKQQLESAQKKLKEIESLQYARKSVCTVPSYKPPSDSQLPENNTKYRAEKAIQKILRRPSNLVKSDLSQSFTFQKRNTMHSNQERNNNNNNNSSNKNYENNLKSYQVSCNTNNNYQLQQNNTPQKQSNGCRNTGNLNQVVCHSQQDKQPLQMLSSFPQQANYQLQSNPLDNSQNNSILDILNCLKEDEGIAESLGESFLKDLNNTKVTMTSTNPTPQKQRKQSQQLISNPRSRVGLGSIQPYPKKIRI